MPQPTRSDVHIDAPLTNISVAYIQKAEDFIAPRVFPIVPVDKQSDKYFTYTKNDWFRDEAQRRAPGTESAGGGYNMSNTSYACDVFAFHKDVPDQVRKNADAPINVDRDATQFVTQRLMLRQEVQWVTDYFATGIWGTDVTGVAAAPGASQFLQWNDVASDPITDIEAGKETILSNTGFMPNKLVIGYQVFRRLKHHPDIVDRVKYTSPETITAAMLAKLFELDEVVVAKAVKATNIEGETAAYSFTHGKKALLCHTTPTPGLLVPSAGYIFAWRGVSGGMGKTIGVKRFRMEHLASDRVEGEIAFDDKVVATDLGYFFESAVA